MWRELRPGSEPRAHVQHICRLLRAFSCKNPADLPYTAPGVCAQELDIHLCLRVCHKAQTSHAQVGSGSLHGPAAPSCRGHWLQPCENSASAACGVRQGINLFPASALPERGRALLRKGARAGCVSEALTGIISLHLC